MELALGAKGFLFDYQRVKFLMELCLNYPKFAFCCPLLKSGLFFWSLVMKVADFINNLD
jgi:hypothetical protein